MIGDQSEETSQSISKNDSAVTKSPKSVGKKSGFKKKVKSAHKLHKKMLSNSGASQPEEIITVPLSGRYKGRGSGFARKKGDKIVSYTCDQGLNYKAGDCVYLENSQPDRPYFICSIQSLRLTKRGTLVAHVKWYFRFYEVPESVYLPLVQDRHTEDVVWHTEMSSKSKDKKTKAKRIPQRAGTSYSGREVNSKQSVVRSRELFTSDATDTYPVSALRGKCQVLHYQEISGAKDFTPSRDSFFYVLGYNPETKRLATTQGEIRVGPSHQARLPEYKPNVGPPQMPEMCAKHEDLKWQPQTVMDEDLVMFLRAARSIAAFAGMCDEGSTEAGCQAASMDDTTMNAMDILHGHKYETGKALQALVRSPALRSIHKKWTEEDAKRFVRGLRLHGKNFFKIRKELLPHRETGDLVEYYYFWKKTPAAVSNRPHRRHRRSGLKRPTVRSSNQPSGDYLDQSSASEVSDETEDSDGASRDSSYACRHCFSTTSKDWHHAGKDKTLLCTECRLHFKKYGEDRPIDTSREPPAFLFKPVKEEDEDLVNGKPIMRTRRNNISAGNNGKKKDRLSTSSPDNVDSPLNGSQKSARKSPSAVSTCSNSSSDIRHKRTDSPLRGSKRHLAPDEDETLLKKKKVLSDSDSAVESDSSGSGNDENGNEGDLENNPDDLSSSSPPTTPSPTDFKLNKDIVKPEAQHLKPQSPLFHPQLTGSHLHPLTPTANRNRSPSPLVNQMNSESLPANQVSSGTLPANPIHLQQEQSGSPAPTVAQDTTNPADSSRAYDQSSNHVSSLKQKDTPINPYHSPVPSVNRTFPLDQLSSHPHHPTNQEQQSVHLSNPMSLYSDEQSANQSHPGGRLERSSSPSQTLPSSNERLQKTLPPTSLPLTSPLSIFPPIYPPVTGAHISHPLAPSPQPVPGLVPIKSEPLSPLLPPTWEETIRREVEKSASCEKNMDVKPVIPLPSETRSENRDDVRPLFPRTEAGPPSLIPSSSVPSQGPQGPMRTSTPNLNPSALPILPSQPAIKGPPPTIPLLAMPPDGDLSMFRPHLIGSNVDKEESVITASDSDREGTPSPGPDPTPCNREIHKSKSAIFLQILNRGSNSCSRCDLIFRPLPDSKLSKKREDRDKKSSHPAPKEEPKTVKRLETPTPPRAHSSEHRVTPISTSQPHTPYAERHTPRSMYTDTPALRQLSEYARPHAMNQDIPRSMPYNLSSMQPHVDPMLMGYRLSMYAPGSRERLELELEMDKRERDARERDLRERELREMEIREKMKAEMEMKPPGLERLMPPGANPLDPQWLELQRRFGGGIPSGSMVPIQGGHPGNPHIPGVYPPASLASDLMAREREKQDRLGLPPGSQFMMGEQAYQREMERASAERFQAERIASDPVLRMQMAAAMHAHMHTHAHSHTHLHVHPQDGLPGQGTGSGPPPPQTASPTFPHLYLPFAPGADPMSSIIGQSAAAVAMAAAAAGSSSTAGSSTPHPLSCLPPGMAPPHVMPGSREHELLQRELYSRMYVDPAVAHQLSAQAHHEALQRQLALDRERYGAGHLPPH